MDVLQSLGPLALASRLRRLTERLLPDGARVYREQAFDFEPRWFTLFYLLSYRSPISIGEAADALGVSHAAVSQLVRELQRKRLVSSTRDPRDERRRRLRLTDQARAMLPALQPVWNDFDVATHALTDGHDLMAALTALERALDEQGLADRVLERTRARNDAPLEIVDFEPEHRADFERLNLAWLERGFSVDAEDRSILDDPQREIIDPGGALLMARQSGRIVGCCGLVPRGPEQLELIKMTVDEQSRGAGIGEHLVRAALRRARQLGAGRVVLETNSGLAHALRLYHRIGFRRSANADLVHERADVWMEIELALDASSRAHSPRADDPVRIVSFEPDHQPQVIHLILGIQAGEFSIPITADDQPDLDDIPRAYQKDGCFFVALDGARVVGTIGMIRFASSSAAIRKMFVHRDYRGSNLAGRLLDAVFHDARRAGIESVTLGTISLLKAAHRFYEKSGFDRIDADELPRDFPRMAVDDRFYQRKL
jgi:N-acetylglutamate synthase-like GNAT family acetyltransferase/DNA-binding MarR family transcriptional regulator